jgi:sulfur-oxidizing protein SoxZ
MSTAEPRVRAPSSAAKGEIIEIKTLITHPMETGLRKDSAGNPIPRKIIHAFSCRYGGRLVFSVDLREAVAANPYMEFYLRAEESGPLDFAWQEDGGAVYAFRQTLTVS